MNIKINAVPAKIGNGAFHYSNMETRYGANTSYFTRDGKPFVPIAGELHFSRCPQESWERELLKMMDCGINVVSTYVFWNYHEELKGQFEFSGDKDIAKFLSICKKIGLPCLIRIGPWCHGEVNRGGFPKRINKMVRKRCDNPAYLKEAEDFWTGLYKEVKPYLDSETVIGIQLENEYTGSTEHIRTLRKIAEKIGFKTSFFTMTAWPSNCPDNDFLPMVGGYPDAPWSMGKKQLTPNNRFSIMPGRTEAEIGEDLHKSQQAKKGAFDHIPYASCETGPGNQVTQHRRPFISEKDGYGVGFAKFASGVNWLGYYMFHGGRNPNDRLMQENRLTGYPNNYPIIDYDFQSPLSRYGQCMPHGDLLRLMHLFINQFDPEVCTKQAFFPKWPSKDPMDISFLKCCVRMNEDMSGYFFASTYEKGMQYRDFKAVTAEITCGEKTVTLPEIDITAGAIFFYPFNVRIGGLLFDYILAQPIAKLEDDKGVTCYFAQCEGIQPCLSVDGETVVLTADASPYIRTVGEKEIKLIVLSQEKARQFHIAGGKPVFAKGTVYTQGTKVVCETADGYLQDQKMTPVRVADRVSLTKCANRKLPYNYFLYSSGKRSCYSLKVEPRLLEENFDVQLEFQFAGLNLQVFSGETLINDYFNIDGKFVMHLREYKKYLKHNQEFIIRAVPKMKWGVGYAYNEKPIPYGSTELTLTSAKAVNLLEETL